MITDVIEFKNSEFPRLLMRMGKPVIYLPIGPAGCGKTTLFTNAFGYGYHGDIIRHSLDEIRFSILDYSRTNRDFDPKIEDSVHKLGNMHTLAMLEQKRTIYFDETNLNMSYLIDTITRETMKHYNLVIIFFVWNTETLIKRNAERKRQVPIEVIGRQVDEYNKMIGNLFGPWINDLAKYGNVILLRYVGYPDKNEGEILHGTQST